MNNTHADEWERVAKLMMEQVPQSHLMPPSDMNMLLQLYQEGGHDIEWKSVTLNVKKPNKTYKVKDEEVDCGTMQFISRIMVFIFFMKITNFHLRQISL